MYQTNDFRKNLKILIDGSPYIITDFQHIKPGKGNQFTRTKLKNMITGSNLERTFKSGEKFEVPDIEARELNYLYRDDQFFYFMDQTSYDQISLTPDDVSDAANYLIENTSVSVLFFNGKPIGLDVPVTINLKVTYTEPGFKGNTATGANKPATLETGLIVHVPLHINEGDLLKVDTRTGEYIERVNK